MLIDARDTIFQTNPFLQVPREKNLDRDDGVLLFFGVSPAYFDTYQLQGTVPYHSAVSHALFCRTYKRKISRPHDLV